MKNTFQHAQLSDAELVLMIQAGNPGDALGELAKRHYQRCVGRARSILRERADAEDAVQDAWIKACSNLTSLSDHDKFVPWLDRIVVTTCIDALRKLNSKDARLAPVEVFEVAALDPDSPQQTALANETDNTVQAAVSALPAKYGEPLRRFHLLGESYKNIAEVLDVPVGTIQSQIARARKRLAVILKPYATSALYCL